MTLEVFIQFWFENNKRFWLTQANYFWNEVNSESDTENNIPVMKQCISLKINSSWRRLLLRHKLSTNGTPKQVLSEGNIDTNKYFNLVEQLSEALWGFQSL
jgi:hypothetical protein